MSGEAGFAVLALLFLIVWGALAFLAGSIYGWRRGQREVLEFMKQSDSRHAAPLDALRNDDSATH